MSDHTSPPKSEVKATSPTPRQGGGVGPGNAARDSDLQALATTVGMMQDQISTLTRELGALQKTVGKALKQSFQSCGTTQAHIEQLEARLATTIKAIVNLSEGKSCLGFTDEDLSA